MSIQTIITIIIMIITLLGSVIITYLYLRDKTLEDIRADVYEMFLQAEHTYLETGAGKQKMKWVIIQARGLLPSWARVMITEALLEKVIENWFRAVKDLLDDGKINRSVKKED